MIRKTYFAEHFIGGQRFRCNLFYEFHVFFNGKRGDKIVKLEYEADFCGSVFCKFVGRQFRNVFSVNENLSFGRTVKTAY